MATANSITRHKAEMSIYVQGQWNRLKLTRAMVALVLAPSLLWGGHVEAQTPQVPPAATPEELKKIKDEATQRKEALEALTAEATARKALAAALDTSKSPTADQLAAAKAAKELADAQKAQADAEKAQTDAATAAAKAKVGDIPASGYGGTAEMGTGAGSAEALLLGTVAVRKIAGLMAAALKKDKPADQSRLMLFTSGTVPDFQALLGFNAQRDALKFAMDHAKESTKTADQNAPVGAMAVATVGLALDAISKVLGYFKTDYKFQGIDVTATDGMLVAALAGELRALSITAQVPALYQAAAPAGAQAVLQEIAEPFNWAEQARLRMHRHEDAQPDLEKQLADKLKIKADDKAKPEDRRQADAAATELQRRLQKVKDAVALWKSLADRLDAWAAKLGTADDKGQVPLANVVRQAALRYELDNGAALVVLQLHKAAGTGYTKKNLWSSLGANPFFVMGGAVASMTAFHGKTGEVFSSMLQPWHGGYRSVSEIQFIVNKP